MSKYADIEQIKEVIRTEWVKYMPLDLDLNLSFVLGKIAEVPIIEVSEDCISREYILCKAYAMDNDNLVVDYENILNAPSAVPKPKEGERILECDAEGEGDNLYRCSECGRNFVCQEYDLPNFCYHCGADMRGEEE